MKRSIAAIFLLSVVLPIIAADYTPPPPTGSSSPTPSFSSATVSGAVAAGSVSTNAINSATAAPVTIKSSMASGSTAVAGVIDTTTTWAASGKLLSLRSNGVQKAYINAYGLPTFGIGAATPTITIGDTQSLEDGEGEPYTLSAMISRDANGLKLTETNLAHPAGVSVYVHEIATQATVQNRALSIKADNLKIFVVDAAETINAAIARVVASDGGAAGKVLYIPAGTYSENVTIPVAANGITIMGCPSDVSSLQTIITTASGNTVRQECNTANLSFLKIVNSDIVGSTSSNPAEWSVALMICGDNGARLSGNSALRSTYYRLNLVGPYNAVGPIDTSVNGPCTNDPAWQAAHSIPLGLGGTWTECIDSGYGWWPAPGADAAHSSRLYGKFLRCRGGYRSFGGDRSNAAIGGITTNVPPNYSDNSALKSFTTVFEDTSTYGSGFGGCSDGGVPIGSDVLFLNCTGGDQCGGVGKTVAATIIGGYYGIDCWGGNSSVGGTGTGASHSGRFIGYAKDVVVAGGNCFGAGPAGYETFDSPAVLAGMGGTLENVTIRRQYNAAGALIAKTGLTSPIQMLAGGRIIRSTIETNGTGVNALNLTASGSQVIGNVIIVTDTTAKVAVAGSALTAAFVGNASNVEIGTNVTNAVNSGSTINGTAGNVVYGSLGF